MTRWLPRSRGAVVAVLLLVAACRSDPDSAAGPPLPDGDVGRVLARAFEASGGWQRWRAKRDVGYVSLLTVVDPARDVTSDSIGWFAAPLHGAVRVRMDSIGLPNQVRFGVDGGETWIVSDGQPVLAPPQLALTRFDLVSSFFWFSLPFGLLEQPATLSYAGTESAPDGTRYEKVRAEFAQPNASVPGRWFVFYFDQETGLIDRVHAQLSAPFLSHDLWIGRWLHYRDWDGIRKERQRQFFPANAAGDVIGALVAEQFIERVQFDNRFAPTYFDRPDTAAPPATSPPMHGDVEPISWTSR